MRALTQLEQVLKLAETLGRDFARGRLGRLRTDFGESNMQTAVLKISPPQWSASGILRLTICALVMLYGVESCESSSSGEPVTDRYYDNDSHGRSYSDPHHGSADHCDHCKH
jgi:hypothetical protein